jgi:hypothetical protein
MVIAWSVDLLMNTNAQKYVIAIENKEERWEGGASEERD